MRLAVALLLSSAVLLPMFTPEASASPCGYLGDGHWSDNALRCTDNVGAILACPNGVVPKAECTAANGVVLALEVATGAGLMAQRVLDIAFGLVDLVECVLYDDGIYCIL